MSYVDPDYEVREDLPRQARSAVRLGADGGAGVTVASGQGSETGERPRQLIDLDDPDCEVVEVASPAYLGNGVSPYRRRFFRELLCAFLGHEWRTAFRITRCRRCKVAG